MRKSVLYQTLLIVAALLPAPAMAQAKAETQPAAPVEEVRPRQDSVLQSQQKVSSAYRDLQNAGHARRLAETDAQRAEMQYKDAQKRADEFKRQYDTANAQLSAAKAKEAQAQKLYDGALNAVDQSFGKTPAN